MCHVREHYCIINVQALKLTHYVLFIFSKLFRPGRIHSAAQIDALIAQQRLDVIVHILDLLLLQRNPLLLQPEHEERLR